MLSTVRDGAVVALHREQFQAARQHRQQVVEVVRDAAGELADRFHLLRLEQRGVGRRQRNVGLLLFGHVAGDLGEADQLARFGQWMASITTCAQKREPSLRTRQPSASKRPVARRSRARWGKPDPGLPAL
jgi:hypothetical protein